MSQHFKVNINDKFDSHACTILNQIIPGILFVLGAIIDEAQGNHDQNNYISERRCSRARTLIVLKWTVLGFLLTISYKSVLRSMMMNVEYENTIDTIDDVLQSDLIFLVAGNTNQRFRLMGDPRKKVKQLEHKIEYYNYDIRNPFLPFKR